MKKYDLGRVSVMTAPYLHHTLAFALDSIAANGFSGVELWGASPHYCRDDFSGRDRKAEARRIAEMLRERGLSMTMFHPEQVRQYPVNIASENAYLRKKSVRVMKDYIEDCLLFGTGRMMLAPGWPFVDRRSGDGLRLAVESAGELSAYAAGLGVTLFMEELDATSTLFTTNLNDLADLIRQVDSPNLRCCLDLQTADNNGETAEDYVRAFGEIGYVHFADFGKDGFMAPGEGRKPLQAQLRALDAAGYAGPLSLYLPGSVHYPDPDRSVRMSACWLKHCPLFC